jgi:hypothetical protein
MSIVGLVMAPQSEARADSLGSLFNDLVGKVDTNIIYYDCRIEKGKVKECGGWSNGYYLLKSPLSGNLGPGLSVGQRYDYYTVKNGKIASTPKYLGGTWSDGVTYVLKIDGLYQKCIFVKAATLKTCVGMFSGTTAVPR